MECIRCKAWIDDYVAKCPHCGMEYHPKDLNPSSKLCRNCHANISEGDSIIEYTVNGNTYRCISNKTKKMKIGKIVKVIYKKSNPIESIHNIFIDLRSFILIIFGIVFFILCNIDFLSI